MMLTSPVTPTPERRAAVSLTEKARLKVDNGKVPTKQQAVVKITCRGMIGSLAYRLERSLADI